MTFKNEPQISSDNKAVYSVKHPQIDKLQREVKNRKM
jgi:hypothetical protein